MTDADAELLAAITRLLDEHSRESLERTNDLARRIDEIVDLQRIANGQLSRVNAEIGFGLPDSDKRADRRSLRQRVHDLENDRAAVRLISARRAADWSRFQKTGIFAFAAIAAVSSILRVFGITI